MKTIFAFLVLALPLAAVAADDPDASFYKNAAEAGISEVDLGNLAEQKASSQDVKDFGAQMVKDHSAANEKLQSLAASKSISLPTSAGVGDMANKAKLELLSGDTFDKSYIKSQIKAHHEAIALFKKESTSGQDPEAKALATATLPTLHEHLHMAYAAAKTLGISTK
jgi:putative membrane protein